MKIFSKYILRNFFKVFLIATAGFLLLFIFSGVLTRLDIFSRYHSSLFKILTFIGLKTPGWILQVLPMSILLALVITVTELKRRNELLAIETSGISMLKIIKPFIFTGLVFSFFLGLFDEGVARKSAKAAYVYYDTAVKGKKYQPAYGRYFNIILQGKPISGGRAFYYIGFFDSEKNSGQNFCVDVHLDKGLRQVFGKKFFYDGGWVLTDGVERELSGDFELEKETAFKRKKFSFPPAPADFLLARASFEEMSMIQLAGHIKNLKRSRIPSARERVNFHARFSSAFSAVIVIIIGIPFGFFFSHVGRVAALVLSVLVCFVYWGFFSLGISLGESGALPPFIGAWFSNILFTGLSLAFLRKKLA
ncbi:MAG: LptF/LptG family permease [bacterium]